MVLSAFEEPEKGQPISRPVEPVDHRIFCAFSFKQVKTYQAKKIHILLKFAKFRP